MKKCRIISKTLFATLIILMCILTPCIASSSVQAKGGGFGKFLLILIGFGLAFVIIYMSYRTDKREEMHLRKVSMAQEKKTKINKKQIENMISTFMKNSTKEIKEKIMAIKDNIGKDTDDYDESEDDLQENNHEKNELDENIDEINDEIDDIDIDDMLLDAIDVEDIEQFEDPEELVIDEKPQKAKQNKTLKEEYMIENEIKPKVTQSQDDDIVSIDFEEVERRNLETSSKDVVAGIVKGYDYDDIEEADNIEYENPSIDTDENSEVDDLLDIILPKRYTRKKTVIEERKIIKKYTRKKEKKKSSKTKPKKFYSKGKRLSRKNKIFEAAEEVYEDDAGIEIDEPQNTNEYVDYKEILDIIEPKSKEIKETKKENEIVTVDRSAIEPFMPKRETAKRGRGRPKKEVVEEKPKRGRGRPKKEVVNDKPKRGRGRPRKNDNGLKA